jgi:hypothetical protein
MRNFAEFLTEKDPELAEGVFGSSGEHFKAAERLGVKAPGTPGKQKCGCTPSGPCEKHKKEKEEELKKRSKKK